MAQSTDGPTGDESTTDLFTGVDEGDDVEIIVDDVTATWRVLEYTTEFDDDLRSALLRGHETGEKVLVGASTGRAHNAPDGKPEGYLGDVALVATLNTDEDNRCRWCGDHVDTDGHKSIDEVDPTPRGSGLMSGPVPICNRCQDDVKAPTGDGCVVCGADETGLSFEIEGVGGVDDLDVYYGGSLCEECSRGLIFDLQQRASYAKGYDE